MTHDPFDTLRSRNPAPPESLPEAPMTVASRISAGHPSLRRGLAIATAAAAMVLMAGGGWLIWSRAGDGREMVAPTTTLVPGTTTTTLPPVAEETPVLVVYFLKDGALMPVARDLRVLNVRPLPELGPLALDLLLWGPGAWDAAPLDAPVAAAEAELTSAILEGTEVLGLTVADGVASVDLSSEFAGASPQAIAQVVYTLTGPYQEAREVRFLIEGVPQVVGSLSSGLFTPYLEPAHTEAGMDSIGREILSMYTPPMMIEHPALGGTLRAGEAVTLLTTGLDATLTLTAADGTLLWNAWAPYGGEPPYLPPEVIMAAGGYGVWATLRAEAASTDGSGVTVTEIPVWIEPTVPFVDEPDIPEATTTIPAAGTAPWVQPPLDDEDVPSRVGDVWLAAANHPSCAVLFPGDVGSLAPVATFRERYFGGDWGFAWDLPSGPGRWEPGGEYCADCGREAFGVAGTSFAGFEGTEDSVWPNRLAWNDGSSAGYGYSHAGYGYEGLSATEDRGEPLLAYLFVEGQDCIYNVWSYLGEEHLLGLIDQLRFVAGYGVHGPDDPDLRSFPADMLTGCAPETARDLASFETALADGHLDLQDLCAMVGVPDGEVGSGLFIPVYDLDDGSRLYLGYTGPTGDGLLYANLVGPDGTVRHLLEG